MNKDKYLLVSFIVGCSVWLSATVLFRTAGHYFFLADNAAVMVVLYGCLIPVLGFMASSVFNSFRLANLESIKSAVIMVLPGMLLDTLCIRFFDKIFPNMPESHSKTFASWLMFAYSVVLISGLLRKDKRTIQ